LTSVLEAESEEVSMVRVRSVIVFVAFLALVVAPVSRVEAADVEYDLMIASAYVWRGLTFTDGAVFQPSVGVAHSSGVSLDVWGNLDLSDANDLSGEFQEVDLTVAYALPISSIVGLELGYIEYLFPNNVGPSTREVYLSTNLDLVVNPFAAVYYDFGEIDDYYAQLGLSHGHELEAALSWEVALWAGYAGSKFARVSDGKGSGFFDGNISFRMSYSPSDTLVFSGFVQYVDSLDSDVLVAPGYDVDWLGGVSLTISL
jgi:uncharacterized protein (TIGR02001 family)